METKILFIALLLAAVMFSGCVESDQLAGTTYEGPEGEILRFFDGGKMHCVNEKGRESMGEYRIEDGRMYFTAGFLSWSADIIGDTLVNGGDVFIKIDQ